MKLNNLIKTNKKKIRPGRGIGSGKGKHLEEVTKVKNQDQELLSKVLKVVKCLYLEDFQKEVLNHLKKNKYRNIKLIKSSKFF